MTDETTHEIQTVEKDELSRESEQTRPGAVYTPAVDIFEDADAITVLADMPGVRADDLKIDLREGVLTMTGEATPPEAETEEDAFREYTAGQFYRRFTVSDRIDQNKIEARVADGVLRLVLPKAEATKPRQIQIKTK
jgi:HSP20 family protein